MGSLLLAAYLVLSLIAVVQAALVIAQTWEHRRFARSRLKQLGEHGCPGRVMLVVPCRGSDVGLEKNLGTLLRQDYDDYRVRFVVESTSDPVHAVICRVLAAHPDVEAEVIVAGQAQTSGQKVHNLLAAAEDFPESVEYLAFVDSDARLRPQWLRALLSRLDQPGVVAATGYRWFIPERSSLANHLLYSINTNAAVFFGARPPTVVWGGSWAIRRERFDALGIRDAWDGTVDDDLVAAEIFRHRGLRVAFEPACMVESPCDTNLRDLLSFVRRQYFISRFYMWRSWALILLLNTLANVTMLANVGAMAWGIAHGSSWTWLPATVSAVLMVLGLMAGWLRQDLAKVYFPQLADGLRKARRFEVWGGPLAALANWLGMLGSVLGRRITWRGIVYRLHRDGRIASIHRGPDEVHSTCPTSLEDCETDDRLVHAG